MEQNIGLTLKERLINEFNIPEDEFDNNNSDLYVKYTKERYDWIKANYEFSSDAFISTFKSNIDKTTWIDIAFWYKEWFDKKNK